MAKIWEEVLGVKGIGVEDDFFSIGGHSLLATQVVSRVREKFNVNLPLREFFESPTIAACCKSLATLSLSSENG